MIILFFRDDNFLFWNSSQWNNIETIHVKMNKMFTPDIILANSLNQNNIFQQYNQTDIIVNSSGEIFWQPIVTIRSLCNINFLNWPSDEQNCSFTFQSASYPGNAFILYTVGKHLANNFYFFFVVFRLKLNN